MNVTSVKIVCTEPGAFHDKYGRTVVATFTRQESPYLDPWEESKMERDAGRYRRKHAGDTLGIPLESMLGNVKRPRVTRLSNDRPARWGRSHVDLRCRGCGLSRREPGDKLWPILDDLTAAGSRRVELRELINRLADTPGRPHTT